MKKHVFGFALFSLIVASFVFVYAFFSAPSIPPKEAVKPPLSRTETRTGKPTACYPKRLKDFSYEIVSANYFAEQGKLVTKVKLYWNGRDEAPATISVQPRIFSIDNYEKAINLKTETLSEPFADGNGRTFSVESKFVLSGMKEGPPNLYVVFDFADGASGNYLTSEKAGLAEAFHVLYVYGESSVIKPKLIVKGRTIPE
jgi:hypothetical protein